GACVQSVVSEREKKTYDFQRATALTTAEIMVGKLTGAPVMPYFLFLCTIPIALIVGLEGGFSFFGILFSYLLIVVSSLLLGLIGLLASMNAEKAGPGAA